MSSRRRFAFSIAAAALAGCSALPQRPVRAIQYDLGPAPVPPQAALHEGLPPLVLGEVETSDAFDTSSLLFRLGYADPNQLRPYAHARWSAPVPQLIRQRLRDRLARERVVLNLTDSAVLARTRGIVPRILRVQLEEFAQWFATPVRSWGVVQLRATLTDDTPAGEVVRGQRTIAVRRPAPTADASGGVRALSAATDAAADEIAQWLQQS